MVGKNLRMSWNLTYAYVYKFVTSIRYSVPLRTKSSKRVYPIYGKKKQHPSKIKLLYEVLPTNLLKYRASIGRPGTPDLTTLPLAVESCSSSSACKAKYGKSSQCCLCWLTINKRVSRSESCCTSDQYETRSVEDKTLRVLSKPSRRRERNSAESNDKLGLSESTNKSCKERKKSSNS